ncbi:MAG: HNH endonuclease [Cellulosilyticaceae bacterium]
MNQNEQQLLKKTFHNEMITLYKRIRKELKYTPPQLFEMINKYGGYEAAIKFIITDMNTFVFTLLWENQRLDLSVEALITKESYETLFSDDVLKFCQKRLQEYNYAPKILPIIKEKDLFQTKERVFDDTEKAISVDSKQETPQKEHIIYTQPLTITIQDWQNLFTNDTIFTAKNKDLLLRMYMMGGCYITHEALAQEEGYNSKYPFKEVITSIGKRIKAALKIDMPTNHENKAIPWHVLFIGWYEGATEFSWSLRPELRHAIAALLESDTITVQDLSVKTTAQMLEGATAYAIPELPTATAEEVEDCSHTTEEERVEDNNQIDEVIPHEEFIEPADDDELLVPVLELDDLPFEDNIYDSFDHLYNTQHTDEVVDKPKREPLSAVSLDDLIDSIFDMDPPKQKKAEPVKTQSVATKIEAPKQDVITKPVAVAKPIEPPVTVNTLEGIKTACLEYYGAVCDICGFDFGYTYGQDFEHLIEIYPVNVQCLEDHLETIDPQKDIIPICSNCKRVIESKSPKYTVEEVKNKMK